MRTPVVIEVPKRMRALEDPASAVVVAYRRRHPAAPSGTEPLEGETAPPAWSTALARRRVGRQRART